MAVVENPESPILESQSPFYLQWRSTRPGRVSWKKDDVVQLATSMKNNLPMEVVTVISDPNYKGGSFDQPEEPHGSPKCQRIGKKPRMAPAPCEGQSIQGAVGLLHLPRVPDARLLAGEEAFQA
ncbi:unnamed protein product [Durusdinium trenchii]|uniref:Uncharacterized protein n=1 Tax=Durusdinium trenchii TaxID=1381693 RepID=A0ABP0N6P8_9DINO